MLTRCRLAVLIARLRARCARSRAGARLQCSLAVASRSSLLGSALAALVAALARAYNAHSLSPRGPRVRSGHAVLLESVRRTGAGGARTAGATTASRAARRGPTR